MPLITPRETVTVDTGNLHTVVHTVRNAHYLDDVPFRTEIVAAAGLLKEALLLPCLGDLPTTEVLAEELWWVVQAADEIGNNECLSPVSVLFTAVDRLALALEPKRRAPTAAWSP